MKLQQTTDRERAILVGVATGEARRARVEDSLEELSLLAD